MSGIVSTVLIVCLLGSATMRAAQADQPISSSAARKLTAGTDVVVVHNGAPARRYLLSVDQFELKLLNLDDPRLPDVAKGILRNTASRHPEYFLGARPNDTFVLERDVRLVGDGIFLRGQKVGDLGNLVETVAQFDLQAGTITLSRPKRIGIGRQIAISVAVAGIGWMLFFAIASRGGH